MPCAWAPWGGASVASPARRIFAPAHVHVAAIESIDLAARKVLTSRSIDGARQELDFDHLVLALGSAGLTGGGTNIYRGHDNVQGATVHSVDAWGAIAGQLASCVAGSLKQVASSSAGNAQPLCSA